MSRTPGERKEVGFSIKMSLEEMAFLEERKKQLNYSSTAEALRYFVTAARTWFGLPRYMLERLEKEMNARGLDQVAYIAEVLAKHSESLGRTSEAPGTTKSRRA